MDIQTAERIVIEDVQASYDMPDAEALEYGLNTVSVDTLNWDDVRTAQAYKTLLTR